VNVGEGVIDFTEIISTLRDVKYDGYLMLEIDKTEKNKADQEVRRGYEYIQAIIRKI
jgi:Sugar phosphate isomerases/epimerases